MNFKAIPSQKIKEMLASGQIIDGDAANIQPASMDLTLSGEAYRMRWTFLPQKNEKISDVVEMGSLYPFDLKNPLEPGATYLIRLKESVSLPKNVFGLTNNKSSSGRVNLEARIVVDGVPRFDRLPLGYKGPLWMEVSSKSFFIKLSEGDKVNQVRFFTAAESDKNFSIRNSYYEDGLLYDKAGEFIKANDALAHDDDNDNSLIMSIDLASGIESPIGYKAIHTGEILDFSRKDFHSARDFFEPLYSPRDGKFALKAGEFYILSTKEFVRVPPKYSMEMVAYDIGSGEFRSHYAGFFDPGFGYGMKGEVLGTPAVLEVKPYDNNFILRDGQPICKMVFVENSEMPDLIYGVGGLGSHYQKQRGAFLSKHFKK